MAKFPSRHSSLFFRWRENDQGLLWLRVPERVYDKVAGRLRSLGQASPLHPQYVSEVVRIDKQGWSLILLGPDVDEGEVQGITGFDDVGDDGWVTHNNISQDMKVIRWVDSYLSQYFLRLGET